MFQWPKVARIQFHASFAWSATNARCLGRLCIVTVCLSLTGELLSAKPPSSPDETATQAGLKKGGWNAKSPRDEVRPRFEFVAARQGQPAKWIIEADEREGLIGWWEKTVPVDGGTTYQFSALRANSVVSTPRRTFVVRLMWRNAEGKPVLRDAETWASYRPGTRPRAEPEYPVDLPVDGNGSTPVVQTLKAPKEATHLQMELGMRWTANARVEWSNIRLEETKPLPPRTARLATIHYRPSGGTTNLEKCQLFAPLIKNAATQEADLVVLPETLTYYGRRGTTYAECAEPVPGPSTEYFGTLAKKHDLYVVAGLLERVEHQVFNVAVLIGPDGEIVGKYRKVTLPRGEIEGGLTPGKSYPVFETRFGKVGMMICYDGFFPEVARELTNNGAEVIAWPVWGCNPLLGKARACENHVYVISSTYTDISSEWMISAVVGHDGRPLALAEKWGDVVVAEVDLNQPLYWHSLGDFKAQIDRHRPVVSGEK
jgi:predicted amidohydrolase